MEYGKNILPTDAAMYDLHKASISNGVLHMLTGGYLKYTFNETDIVALSEYVRVSLVPEHFTPRYMPRVSVHIHLETEDGAFFNDALYPTEFVSGVYLQELQLKAGKYKTFTFEIFADEAIDFTLWELCPEAADEDIQVIIEGVEQSLPRLLFDYNTWPLVVNADEKTIALITFRLLDATDLQGHLQMTYVASEPCTLTLRFKDNGSTELFAPLLYDLHAGRGSVGVPHAYLERLAGIHAVIVTAQVSSGTLTIDTRGILFTIDGGYLAERTLDIGVDMRDLSIRQLAHDYGPDEIWIIGIEAGEAFVRRRLYDPKTTITFEPLYSLGKAKDAAIEFDGNWVLRPDDDCYTLETYEEPWVFWINAYDELVAQIGNDETTRVTLDTQVSSMYVCRGYKSAYYPDFDQGLICAYIKEGKAYYTQYLYEAAGNFYRWTQPELVDESLTGVTQISVGRLNDYRVQITVKYSGGIKTYISDRTYVNQAVPKETLFLSDPLYTPFAYYPSDYDTSVNVIEHEFIADSPNAAYQLNFTVDKILELKAYDIAEFITFNNSIPEYNSSTGEPYVKKVYMKPDEKAGKTHFEVWLNYKPTKLITEVYINTIQDAGLQEKVGQYGYIICPKITVQYDTINYVTLEPAQNMGVAILPAQKAINFSYIPIQYTNKTVLETAQLPGATALNFAYIPINKIESKVTETVQLSDAISLGFAYTAISDQPI